MIKICIECGEDDPFVLVACCDGITRCAHHANIAGFCWDCGYGDPVYDGNEEEDGLCYDCRSSAEMLRRRIIAGVQARIARMS